MSDFTDAINHHCEGMRVATGSSVICAECVGSHNINERDARGRFRSVDDMQSELSELESGSFSWSACDTCGSSFGGDRHDAHGLSKRHPDRAEMDVIHLDICTDCLFYFANGDEPDEWYPSPHAAREAGR